MKKALLVACAALALAGLAAAPASRPASSRPASEILASDEGALARSVDMDVTIEGDVIASTWSRSGKVLNVAFANADGKTPSPGTGLTAVIFSQNRAGFDAAFSGDVAKALSGAHVKITGKLVAYGGYDEKMKGSKQVVLRKPEQIVSITRPAPTTQP